MFFFIDVATKYLYSLPDCMLYLRNKLAAYFGTHQIDRFEIFH
jgi:hypothetical protein